MTLQFYALLLLLLACNHVVISNENAGDQSHDTQGDSEETSGPPVLPDVKDVIVIGGGIAGMAAARKLTNHNQFNVKVLEACEDRYGGRVWTDRKSGGRVRGVEADLGVMWLNSKRPDNPLMKLVKDLELEIKSPGPVQIHVPNQDTVYKGEDADKIFSEYIQILIQAIEKAKKSKKDIPLSEAVQSVLKTTETETDKAIMEAMMTSHYTTAVTDYSTRMLDIQKDFGWDFTVVDGFDQVVDGIVSGMEGEIPIEIELGTVVRQIEVRKGQQKVVVRTTDLKQHFADAVVLALPLGVLKNQSVLFDPLLPRNWYTTINKLGVTSNIKLILEFDEIFWPSDVGFFILAPATPSEYGLFQAWINMHYFTGKPVLMAALYGDRAEDFKESSNEELKKEALSVLSKIFDEETVSRRKVTKVLRSKFESDPFFLGSASYPKYGFDDKELRHLSDPVCPCIFFAGEHTDLENLSTALGAYNSGVRAAEQIISGFCDKKTEKKKGAEDKGSEIKETKRDEQQINQAKDEL